MDREKLEQLSAVLQKLVGQHRELLDWVKKEHQALQESNLDQVQRCCYSKEALIYSISKTEKQRVEVTRALGVTDQNLNYIILESQAVSTELSDRLRSIWNVLKTLVERIAQQNEGNQKLVHGMLEHLNRLKENIVGSLGGKSGKVYDKKGGQGRSPHTASQLISKEV